MDIFVSVRHLYDMQETITSLPNRQYPEQGFFFAQFSDLIFPCGAGGQWGFDRWYGRQCGAGSAAETGALNV